MTDHFERVMEMLEHCTPDEQELVFKRLREQFTHPLEEEFMATAEFILDAMHRAGDMTKRMLRGVIGDAAFGYYVIPQLIAGGWTFAEESNDLYDYRVSHAQQGDVTIQVKLQRSVGEKVERVPAISNGRKWHGVPANHYLVEVQRTRGGKRKRTVGEGEEAVTEEVDTRPYAFDSFDVLAVSLWPSTGDWSRFRYTICRRLRPDANGNIEKYQGVPINLTPGGDWTDDFAEVVQMLRTPAPIVTHGQGRAVHQFPSTVLSPQPSGLFTPVPPDQV